MPTLSVDGDALHFSDEGAGVPVVFVHGSCGGGGQWRALASALKERYRTVCVDLFGSGKSEAWPLERVWSRADDDRALSAVLDYLGEPAHFIVHSGGGIFSYQTIADNTAQVRSLTLFEPVFFHLLHHRGDPLFAEPEGMANRYRAAIEEGDLEQAMSGFVDDWAGAPGTWMGMPDGIKQMMQLGANRLYHEWTTVRLDGPTEADLGRLQVPALLFKGSETKAAMHRVCEILQSVLPDCRFREVPGAGHMGPFTHAADVLPNIEVHLAGQDGSR